MIQVHCVRCKSELDDTGALIFSPPWTDKGEELVNKYHVCWTCYSDLFEWMGLGE